MEELPIRAVFITLLLVVPPFIFFVLFQPSLIPFSEFLSLRNHSLRPRLYLESLVPMLPIFCATDLIECTRQKYELRSVARPRIGILWIQHPQEILGANSRIKFHHLLGFNRGCPFVFAKIHSVYFPYDRITGGGEKVN